MKISMSLVFSKCGLRVEDLYEISNCFEIAINGTGSDKKPASSNSYAWNLVTYLICQNDTDIPKSGLEIKSKQG